MQSKLTISLYTFDNRSDSDYRLTTSILDTSRYFVDDRAEIRTPERNFEEDGVEPIQWHIHNRDQTSDDPDFHLVPRCIASF